MQPLRWYPLILLISSPFALAGCSFFPGAGTDRARYCSDLLTADFQGYESLDEMAWYSHVIVVGTVSEPQGSRWAPDEPSEIVTDYTVAVEQWVRGEVLGRQQVPIRVFGGKIEDCVQLYNSWPPFEPGDRSVFFLRDYEGSTPPRYDLFGWGQGYWNLDRSGMVTNRIAPDLWPGQYPTPLGDFVSIIRKELGNGPPPQEATNERYLVPLEESPISTP
jgi:hypothetical protein